MPRPKKAGAPEPKRRSRTGCWPCKARKVKCGEEKPSCLNCDRQGETCDYSIRLNWGGRTKRTDGADSPPASDITFNNKFQTMQFSVQQSPKAASSPTSQPRANSRPPAISVSPGSHATSPGAQWTPGPRDEGPLMEPNLMRLSHEQNMSRLSPTSIPDQASTFPSQPPSSFPGTFTAGAYAAPTSRPHTASNYPSPATPLSDSAVHGEHVTHFQSLSPRSTGSMLPPLRGFQPYAANLALQRSVDDISPGHRDKRMKLSAPTTSPGPHQTSHGTSSELSSYGFPDSTSNAQPLLNPYSPFTASTQTPITPGSSNNGEEKSATGSGSRTGSLQAPPDLRRLSVQSLLSGPQEGEDQGQIVETEVTYQPVGIQVIDNGDGTKQYGFDYGLPDLDIPNNDDSTAIGVSSPTLSTKGRMNSIHDAASMDDTIGTGEFGFRLHFPPTPSHQGNSENNVSNQPFEPGGYYAHPVPLRIPDSLHPLPPILTANNMNLLYFHFYLEHTARILVPNDCPENPFRTVLPKLAVKHNNLLKLLLAYSASHRARLLGHKEPANRIAVWVEDVFPSLRHALEKAHQAQQRDPSTVLQDDDDDKGEGEGGGSISNANLATAIMLASLEIISPNTFEVPITWQKHLSLARSLILAQGGLISRVHHKDKEQEHTFFFLARWFSYLDVLGCLSGARNELPLPIPSSSSNPSRSSFLDIDEDDADDDAHRIDCLLGFTSRVMVLLARVAELARRCDADRIDEHACVKPLWQPAADIRAEALALDHELREGDLGLWRGCVHCTKSRKKNNGSNNRPSTRDGLAVSTPTTTTTTEGGIYSPSTLTSPLLSTLDDESGATNVEIRATNQAFRAAARIHLYTRVLNHPSPSAEVQACVTTIVGLLAKIRQGGTAEANLLFPLFSAGCASLPDRDVHSRRELDTTPGVRRAIIERMERGEALGMTQWTKARSLMLKVWETGRPWETLVTGEFFG